MPINVYRKDSIFSMGTANSFKNLMRTFMQTESSNEATRQNISRNPYFDPQEAFDQCDLSRSGYVSRDELRYLMESKGMRVTNADAEAVAKTLDFNKDGVVTAYDMRDSLRPRSPARHSRY